MKLYNLGSLNIDYVYTVPHFVSAGETLSGEKLEIFPGGKGLNQSIALAKAGVHVLHGAVLGEDGDSLLRTLSDAGVDVSRIDRTDERCGHAIIQVDRNGQNCILLYPGSNYAITKVYAEQFLRDAQENDLLLLQNEVNDPSMIFSIAKQKKMQIAWNPSPFHPDLPKLPLNDVTWWFCNETEAAAFFGDGQPEAIADRFAARFPDANLILTLGENGSLFRSGQRQLRQAAYPVSAVDTTAAGDTFTGYFLASLLKSHAVADALDIAAKASAVAVSRKGAASSIPTMQEVLQLFP